MAASNLFLASLLTLLMVIGIANADSTCPFSRDCKCEDANPPQQYVYDAVTCKVTSSFPTFTAPAGVTYKVANKLSIQGKLDVIPAKAFSIFSSINDLSILNHRTTPLATQNWNKDAFVGTSIVSSLYIDGLANALPLPSSFPLSKLASLQIVNSDNVELSKDALAHFDSLTSLNVLNTKISKVDDDAFLPMRNSLTKLWLTSASLTDASQKAISSLTNVDKGFLDSNQFTDIDLSNFPIPSSSAAYWHFDNNDHLKSVTVSDVSKVSTLALCNRLLHIALCSKFFILHSTCVPDQFENNLNLCK
jgi:hypothetical protein